MQVPTGTGENTWLPGAAKSTSDPVHENPVSESVGSVKVVASTCG